MTYRVYLIDTALELIEAIKTFDTETGKEIYKGYIFPCPYGAKQLPMAERIVRDMSSSSHAVRRYFGCFLGY